MASESCGFSIFLTTEVVPKIFPNFNVVGHLAVPAGWVLACRGWLVLIIFHMPMFQPFICNFNVTLMSKRGVLTLQFT